MKPTKILCLFACIIFTCITIHAQKLIGFAETENGWGAINSKGEYIVPAGYVHLMKPDYKGRGVIKGNNYISYPVEGFMRFKNKQNLWGFINTSGEIVIEPKYTFVSNFENGIAIANSQSSSSIIDKTGKVLLNIEGEKFIRLTNNKIITQNSSRDFGYRHLNGEQITDNIYKRAHDFSDGLAAVLYKNKWGFIDTNGVKPFDFKIKNKDLQGIYALRPGIARYTDLADALDLNDFEDSVVCVEDKIGWKVFNTKGEQITSLVFDMCYGYSEGVFIVEKYMQLGGIHGTGFSFLIKDAQKIYPYIGDYAQVKKFSKWGVINKMGQIVIPCEYDNLEISTNSFIRAKKRGKWGYFDNTGKQITEFIFTYAKDFSDGMAAVKKAGKSGFINEAGELVIDYKYIDTEEFNNGLCGVKEKYKWGYINKNGELIIDYKYQSAMPFVIVD